MKNFSEYFSRRDVGHAEATHYCLDKEAPKNLWALYSSCCEIVAGSCWTAETMLDAFEELEVNENDLEDCNIEPDCYYSNLDRWFCECEGSAWLCNEAVEEGLADGKDIYKTIGAGQYLAKSRIYGLVHEFLKENVGEVEGGV